jgi:C1A family cysteine protease
MHRKESMQNSYFSLSFCQTILWGLVSSALSITVVNAQEYSALPSSNSQVNSKYTQFVVSELLQQMGLELPVKRQQPKKKTESDDFFSNDFFANDNQSFDEIKKSMETTFAKTNKKWQSEYQDTVAKWDKARAEFLGKVTQYEENTFDVDNVEKEKDPDSSTPTQQLINIVDMQPGEFYVIPGAMEIAIRNQARRGTCAAFAGVRAIEVILNQNDIRKDFSEQHFYWLSKPKCIKQACPATPKNQGSWFVNGLLATRAFKSGLLPEASCPYVVDEDANNETQTPLVGCKVAPGVQAKELVSELSLGQLLSEISANRPVMSGFTLSDNFYFGKGVVNVADEGKYDNKSTRHSGGHALLLVGFIRLPDSMSSEGQYCAITANSWGDGWGRGGYGCLTENWMKKHSIGHASLQSVELVNKI